MVDQLLKQFGISAEEAFKAGLNAVLSLCSEAVQLEAVGHRWRAVQFIENPSDEIVRLFLVSLIHED